MKYIKTLTLSLFFVLMSLHHFTGANAGDIDCKDISAPEVKNLLDHDKAVVVNVLSSFEYDIQHIEKSISIPVNKITEQKDKLPKDKGFSVVFYCMGTR